MLFVILTNDSVEGEWRQQWGMLLLGRRGSWRGTIDQGNSSDIGPCSNTRRGRPLYIPSSCFSIPLMSYSRSTRVRLRVEWKLNVGFPTLWGKKKMLWYTKISNNLQLCVSTVALVPWKRQRTKEIESKRVRPTARATDSKAAIMLQLPWGQQRGFAGTRVSLCEHFLVCAEKIIIVCGLMNPWGICIIHTDIIWFVVRSPCMTSRFLHNLQWHAL